jgi:hypothetical protein
MNTYEAWPELPYREWASTKKTLQMCTQMLGKARLALAPPQPEWLHSCLYLDGRGFTTGPMPDGGRIVHMGIDVFDSVLWISTSDGERSTIPLGPDRCVADVWSEFQSALSGLAIGADLWDKPQESEDTTPLSENRHDCEIVPEYAQRFYRVLGSLNDVFEEFRSDFFGRTSIQFWWGGFDFAVLLFTGRKLEVPEDAGYIMRYDLDVEHLNVGFWPGNDDAPPMLYGYVIPSPDGAESAPVEPEAAMWSADLGEWVLPYDAVRTSEDPRADILAFLRSVYGAAVDHGGWDKEDFAYVKPAPSKRGG